MEKDDFFWNDLLDAIEEGHVIPVVGQSLVTNPDGTLQRWLALQLATALGFEYEPSPEPLTIDEVVCTYLKSVPKAKLATVYQRIKQILQNHPFQIPSALEKLASISHFKLFLTTNFDTELESALNKVRFAGNPMTRVVSFHPNAREKDLPARCAELETTLYYLLGRYSNVPTFAAWDDDSINYLLALHDHLKDQEVLPNLSRDLQSHHLLILGTDLDDWLSRLLLRVARQHPLPQNFAYHEYFTAHQSQLKESFVLYCEAARVSTEFINQDPVSFVDELYQRWISRYGDAKLPTEVLGQLSYSWPNRYMPKGAIFLSYAREDLEATKTIRNALVDSGCEVWFDQDRLQAGENWSNTLEQEVKERCSLFLSVISTNTEKRPRYCLRERSWASERSADFGNLGGFYIPVIIDELSPEQLRLEPLPSVNPNFAFLPDGTTTPDFLTEIHALHQRNLKLTENS